MSPESPPAVTDSDTDDARFIWQLRDRHVWAPECAGSELFALKKRTRATSLTVESLVMRMLCISGVRRVRKQLVGLIIRGLRRLERVKGIEPSSQAWEARILPLNHTRNRWEILLAEGRSGRNSLKAIMQSESGAGATDGLGAAEPRAKRI